VVTYLQLFWSESESEASKQQPTSHVSEASARSCFERLLILLAISSVLALRSPTTIMLLFCIALLLLQSLTRGAFLSSDGGGLTNRARRPTELELNEFRIVNKKRSKVVVDPKTGFYRPERTPIASEQPPARSGKGLVNAWNALKDVVYGSVDGIRSVPDRLKGKDEKGIIDGYAEVQERIYKKSGSPGERFLREYENRGGPVLDSQDSGSASVFDTVKGAVYGTLDTASSLATPQRDGELERLESFKPVVKSSLGSSQEIRSSINDLQSSNPVKKLIAKNKIRDFEKKERDVQAAIERHKNTRAVKEVAYRLGDAAQSTAKELSKLPDRVSGLYKRTSSFMASIPNTVERTIDAVADIPNTLQDKVAAVQKSIDGSIDSTKQAIEGVKAIPIKVKETAENVERTARQTGENFIAAVDTVDETLSKGKVLLGLEKPKPRPPNLPPPKPLSASDVGWKIAGGVATAAANVAWWVGKSAAFLTWKGAQFALEKGVEAWNETDSSTVMKLTSVPSIKSAPPKTAPLPTGVSEQTVEKPTKPKEAPKQDTEKPKSKRIEVERNPDLDVQVSEALKLAEEALKGLNATKQGNTVIKD